MPAHTQKMAWRMIVGYTCIFIRLRDPELPELSCTWKIKVYINSWTWIQTLQVEYAGAFSEAPEPKFRSGNQTTRQPMSGTRAEVESPWAHTWRKREEAGSPPCKLDPGSSPAPGYRGTKQSHTPVHCLFIQWFPQHCSWVYLAILGSEPWLTICPHFWERGRRGGKEEVEGGKEGGLPAKQPPALGGYM